MSISSTDLQFLQDIRTKADDLARLLKEAAERGYQVNLGLNGTIGACDVFQVHQMVPVDLRGSAN